MSDKPRTNPCQARHARDVKQWDKETEVAIVGFGGAGGCAAIEAADAGATVTIFELASASGGSTAMSSAEIYMGGGGGTRVQRACGFEDSTEDMFTYMMMAAGPQADEAKIRNYCENSLGHFNWLVDHLGVPFKGIWEMGTKIWSGAFVGQSEHVRAGILFAILSTGAAVLAAVAFYVRPAAMTAAALFYGLLLSAEFRLNH